MFSTPIPFASALAWLRRKGLLPTSAGSAEISTWPADVRERSLFSARQMREDVLAEVGAKVDRILNPTTELREDGTPVTKGTNFVQARADLQKAFREMGVTPDAGTAGTLQDHIRGQSAVISRAFDISTFSGDPATVSTPTVKKGSTQQVPLTLCPFVSGTYTTVTEDVAAEPIPVGLARQLYDALNDPQYDGQISLAAAECPALGLGCVLNLTGGRAEWLTARALVQTADYDIDAGTTTLRFGPANHLGVADIIELLRAARQRRITVNYDTRMSGKDPASANATPIFSAAPTVTPAGDEVLTQLLLSDGPNSILIAPGALGSFIGPNKLVLTAIPVANGGIYFGFGFDPDSPQGGAT